MLSIGSYNSLVVARSTVHGLFLTTEDGDEVLLPRKYSPEEAAEGDPLRVFVYKDSEDRNVATTLRPKAVVGEFARLRVVDVNKVGAFLDWGLDKDLFVPFREQTHRLKIEEWCVVFVELDDANGRIIGTTWLRKHFSPDVEHLSPGDPVHLISYARSERGVSVVVNRRHSGLIHAGDEVRPVKINDEFNGFVRKVRDDHTLDIMLRKPGYDGALDEAEVVLAKLRAAGGSLPVSAKSDAETIRNRFGMSRKTFKKIIGNLYKTGIIAVDDDGIRLK